MYCNPSPNKAQIRFENTNFVFEVMQICLYKNCTGYKQKQFIHDIIKVMHFLIVFIFVENFVLLIFQQTGGFQI